MLEILKRLIAANEAWVVVVMLNSKENVISEGCLMCIVIDSIFKIVMDRGIESELLVENFFITALNIIMYWEQKYNIWCN